MKRISMLLLAALFVFASAAGCGPASNGQGGAEEKNYCFDYRVRSIASGGGNYIIETDDSVFFILNGFLYFSDKENKDFMPLCPRPDCAHNDPDCDAYIDASNFTVYGSYIYYVDGEHDDQERENMRSPWLCRMRLDGSSHERLMAVPMPEADFEWTLNVAAVSFTGKYAVAHSRAADEMLRHDVYYDCVIALDTLETCDISMPWVDFEFKSGLIPMVGSGSDLYCQAVDSTYDAATATLTQKRYLCRLDCETGEVFKIGLLAENAMTGEFDYYLTEDAFYYTCWASGQPRRVMRCGLEDGVSVEVASGLYGEINWNQFDWQNGMMFLDFKGESETMRKGIYWTDLDFNTVDFCPYTEEQLAEFKKVFSVFQTESYVFGIGPDKNNAYSAQGSVPGWYIDKTKVGTGDIMWRRWEP